MQSYSSLISTQLIFQSSCFTFKMVSDFWGNRGMKIHGFQAHFFKGKVFINDNTVLKWLNKLKKNFQRQIHKIFF